MTSGRFLINTTFGILGIFDPAQKLGLKKLDHEDYGQTLGFWGVGPWLLSYVFLYLVQLQLEML